MNRVLTVNAGNASEELTRQMFEGYDAAIRLESDKSTYEEFLEVLSSADEHAQYYFTFIREGNWVVCGTVSVRLWIAGCVVHGIVYAFTDKHFRNRGFARRVIAHLVSQYRDAFWFCEVLDESKISKAEILAEEAFCGVSCAQRERFWGKMGFRKADFDYANPGLESGTKEERVISYNNLWLRSAGEIQGDELLAALYAYFLYEYGAGEAAPHLEEAYKYNNRQIAGKAIG